MVNPIRNIVLGVADTNSPDPHLPAAAALAERLDATLHVVNGFYLPDPTLHPYPEISALRPDALQHLREGAQDRLERMVHGSVSSDRIRCRAVAGTPEQAITRVAGEVRADLVIVGATRLGRVGRFLLGTTAQRVVRSSPSPVLVLRSTEWREPRRILFATDLSPASAEASAFGLGVAESLTDRPEKRFVLVLGYDLMPPPPLSRSAYDDAAAGELRRFVEALPVSTGEAELHVASGEPTEVLVSEAGEWGADLLVLGSQGRSGLPRLLIGSVAEFVVKRAPCDVLVVRPRGEEGE